MQALPIKLPNPNNGVAPSLACVLMGK